ncbi:MAG: single-stranded-DNA-specific exonuclease RecJ [SAR202 cluster bacterium Casp-Chloro-G2]|nr:MAG: single-stranded-DNA-specific exonuclease RecJ [SAR202 cluster bacterium Casp-Chloro-G2]
MGTTGGRERPWSLPATQDISGLSGHVPPAIARLLVKRGIDTPLKLTSLLDPPHKLPHDPLRIAGMDVALRRLYSAVNNHEKVGVFGDFDVDGITGTAIIFEGLTSLGVAVTPYLPHRVDEGHGLSNAAVDTFASDGITLIVTVDCGITAFEEVDYARTLGVDVIITDHHLPHDGVPNAVTSLNPKVPGGNYPFFELCGAGIGFKLIQGLYEFYGQPWDPGLLELAALGTIADLVPLLDENRYLVQEGLRELANTRRPGLRALYSSARVDPNDITAETVSFQIAPRLNSAGRMGDPMDSFRLLTTTSPEEAGSLTHKLESLNLERRAVTEETYEIAKAYVEDLPELPSILVVSDERFLRGVAGLIAGRLVDRYRRPAVVIAIEGETSVASGRSIPEFNIAAAFESCEDLLVRFGGHSQAAGLTVPTRDIPLLKSRLEAYSEDSLETQGLERTVEIDSVINLDELDAEAVRWIRDLEPYGPGNTRPVFATLGAKVSEYATMGREKQHLRLRVEMNGVVFTALAFNQADRWRPSTEFVDLAYTVTNDTYRGNGAIALRMLDFRPSRD